MLGTSAMLAAQAPPIVLPAALERQIPKIDLLLGDDGQLLPESIRLMMRPVALPAMGVEVEPYLIPSASDPRRQPPLTLLVGPGALSAALNDLRARVPQYDIWADEGVIGIAPTTLRRNPKHFLNVPISFFRVKDMSFHRAVSTLLNQLEPSVRISEWREPPIEGSVIFVGPRPDPAIEALTKRLMDRPVTVSVENMSARDILNRLVAQHHEMVWTATYEIFNKETGLLAEQRFCNVYFFPTVRGTSQATFSLRTGRSGEHKPWDVRTPEYPDNR